MTDFALHSSAAAPAFGRDKGGPRIGLVGPLPPPAGGMAMQCRQLYELLQSEGLGVTLVQTNAPYRPRWVERVRGVRALFRLLPYLVALRRVCGTVDVVHLMANSGWAWHLFAAPAVWIARWQGVPVIINYRGGDAERFLQRAPKWVAATMRSAEACIVPSGFLRQVLERHGVAADIIANIVDHDLFKPLADQRTHRGAHIVITRNLEAIYGIDDALRAFALVAARCPDARLTIAGEGPERDALAALAGELGLSGRVSFVGRLARSAMAALYREADIMLNPSTIDNMPNSILEAYASGVPVVSTNVGGVPFIARDNETALLVPPRDPAAMADRMCRLIDDRALAGALAQRGLQEAAQYAWTRVGGEWMRLYKRLAAPGALSTESR